MASFHRQVFTHSGIIAGGTIFLALILFFLVRDLKARTEGALVLNSAIEAKIITIHSLAALKDDSVKARALLAVFSPLLPLKEDLINLPKEIIRRAKALGVDASFAYTGEAKKSQAGLGGLFFTMTTSSSYSAFAAFLHDLETLPFFIRLQSLDVVRGERDRFSATGSGQIFSR